MQGPVVYNAVPIGCTWKELINKGGRGNRKFTYPTFGFRGMTSSAVLHWILVMLFEWLPSALSDTILGLCGARKRYSELEVCDIRDFLESPGREESVDARVLTGERFHGSSRKDAATVEAGG